MPAHLNDTDVAVIAPAPAWVRQALTSSEEPTRVRAEETLVAMIAQALSRDGVEGD